MNNFDRIYHRISYMYICSSEKYLKHLICSKASFKTALKKIYNEVIYNFRRFRLFYSRTLKIISLVVQIGVCQLPAAISISSLYGIYMHRREND